MFCKIVWQFPKGYRELPNEPAIPLLCSYTREMKHMSIQKLVLKRNPTYNSQNVANSLNVHQLMNEQTKCNISIQWLIIQSYKGMKHVTTWIIFENIIPNEGSQ